MLHYKTRKLNFTNVVKKRCGISSEPGNSSTIKKLPSNACNKSILGSLARKGREGCTQLPYQERSPGSMCKGSRGEKRWMGTKNPVNSQTGKSKEPCYFPKRVCLKWMFSQRFSAEFGNQIMYVWF